MRRLVRLDPLGDLPIQKHNLLVQPRERVDQDLEDRSDDLRAYSSGFATTCSS